MWMLGCFLLHLCDVYMLSTQREAKEQLRRLESEKDIATVRFLSRSADLHFTYDIRVRKDSNKQTIHYVVPGMTFIMCYRDLNMAKYRFFPSLSLFFAA